MIATLLALLLATVNAPYSPPSYACDGVTAAFTVPFPYQASSDLKITSTTAAGVSNTLTQGTDWSVNLSSTSSTATLTLTSPGTKCPSGNVLKVERNAALTQPKSFRSQTTYDPIVHEIAHDRAVMEIQQVNDKAVGTGTPASTAYVDQAIANTLTGGTVVQPLTWNLTGDGSTTVFSIPNAAVSSPDLYIVTIDGVFQRPTIDYTVSSGAGTVTFASAPALNGVISVRSTGYARALSVGDNTSVLATGTSVPRDLAHREADTLKAADFGGADVCAKIQAALVSLPVSTNAVPGGGTIDARMFTGLQPCASNPVAQTGDATTCGAGGACQKPFKLLLGPAVFQVAVPWVYGEGADFYKTGQTIEGCGIECTFLQPTAGFTGSVIQIKPPGADVVIRQTSFHDLSIDMNNVSGKTGFEILSASNLPLIYNVTVIRNNGRCLHMGPKDAASAIVEGVTFDNVNCYHKTPKTTNGAEIGNANEITWRNSKIMGSFDGTPPDKNFVGVLYQSELQPAGSITTPGEGLTMPGTSVDSFDTGIKFTAAGAWASARNSYLDGLTLENLNTGVNLAGRDASNKTTGNMLSGIRYLSTVTTHVSMDFASDNLVIEGKQNAGVASYALTANSSNNMLIRQFSQANKSDVSDLGTGNQCFGWLASAGIQLGCGQGSGAASNAQVQIDSGSTGSTILQWTRNQVVKMQCSVSDSLGTDEFDCTSNGKTWRYTTGGVTVFPSTINNASLTQASLPASNNGAIIYCSDCTIANPCAGGGTGALAKRLNGVWVCN